MGGDTLVGFVNMVGWLPVLFLVLAAGNSCRATVRVEPDDTTG